MNKLSKLLPALALVLGAFAAVAFTSPDKPQPEYGLDGSNWINVENLQIGQDYLCNESEEVCTRTAPSITAPMVKEGTFEFLGQ
ncbi:hypothetical protein GYM62_17720 [Algoriphagus sp. NBT04N3]|jgi:hypothetical protein|uniref:hypothetical protein n=1 Tax=Algoriphagus sp. NBT04N3 TaxID=2705473 RepID=UPI001C639F66|nr:hypothetical protein [Algoriphagus sp. NBT04N3]QYH40546.1 hypothetical protein GYM62_17720 [Algoriphagus sp. NBT04N3]